MTYNRYLTEVAQKTPPTSLGVSILKVRMPQEGEEVDGYTNYSAILAEQTVTDKAAVKGE